MAGDVNYGNVVLLLHCNGTNGSTTITDSSPTPKVAVLTGNTSISTTNSKFGGASIYFDGTGDILNFTPLTDFAFGTGDFTIELFATAVSTGALVDMRVNSSTNGSQPILYFTAGTIRYYTNLDDRITSGVLTNGQMYHFAVCRSGTSTKMFVDGVQVGSTYTDSNNYVAGSMTFGATANGLGPYQGYIDEVRITKGVARYTANFSVPTAAFLDYAYRVSGTVLDQLGAPAARAVRAYRRGTGALVASTVTDTSYDANYGNVILLLNGLGKAGESTFIDSSTKARLQSSLDGTPVVSSTITKFGNSIYFDGAGDRINYAASADFYLTNTYTIELWMYVLALPGGGNNCRAMMIGNNGSASAFSLNIDPSGAVSIGRPLGGSTGCASAAGVITVGQWKHCAFSVSAGLGTCYINGTRSGTANQPVTSQDGGLVGMSIGYDTVGTVNFNYYGYIDDLRITKGVARYTADFTAPTAPFANRVSSPGLGNYVFDLLTTDELTIVAFDDQVSGTIYNDRVIRVIPA